MSTGVRDSGLRQSLWIPAPDAFDAEDLGTLVARLARSNSLRPVLRCRMVFAWSAPNRSVKPHEFIAIGRPGILRGLVVAGVLPGDGWDCVVGFHDTWVSQPERPGVLVVIEEACI